jgi:hypothetical protein
MSTLFVAAGGGGDAVGALLAQRLLGAGDPGDAQIATCAWERLRVDPVPGPRDRTGFSGLGLQDGVPCEVLPTTETIPPGRSMLPRLAGAGLARLFLFDFSGGAIGLAEQLRGIAAALDARHLVVLDVGGDILGRPGDRGLLSPLADSLTLAAALSTGLPASLAVVAPGSDGELDDGTVRTRLRDVGGTIAGEVRPEDVQRCRSLLSWHPTEASTLAAAAALGVRGSASMRRGGAPTPINDHTAEVWTVAQPDPAAFPLAEALQTTTNLAEAEDLIRALVGSEIDFEREKAGTTRPDSQPKITIEDVVRDCQRDEATHITTRRLLELLGENTASSIDAGAQVDGLGLWRVDWLAVR